MERPGDIQEQDKRVGAANTGQWHSSSYSWLQASANDETQPMFRWPLNTICCCFRTTGWTCNAIGKHSHTQVARRVMQPISDADDEDSEFSGFIEEAG